MDRREYLGVTGSGIIALLGGCSSSGSQSTTTATDTATATATATATPTETATETATTTTVAEDDTKFEISRPFQEFVTQELMQKPPTRKNDDGQEVVKGYDPDPVGPYTEHFAETVLSQMSNIPSLNPSMGYRDVVEMAGYANWVAKHIHEKNLTPEQSFLPTSMAVDNTVVNVIDANFNGPTTLLAQRGDTSKSNILNHEELETWLNGGGVSNIESELALAYANEEGYDDNFRWIYLDVVEEAYEKAGEESIGGFHIDFGKDIPGFYPLGRVPAQPQIQPHRSIAEYGQEQVIETVEEDGEISLKHGNLNKVKGEMRQAIYQNVRADELAVPYVDNNGNVRAVGRPKSDYDPSSLWASDGLIP